MTNFLLSIGPFAPFAVFALAAAESGLFLGFVIPGELAVILGGVAAGTGSVSLPAVLAAAVAGAVVGDSIGYQLGRRFGPSLLSRSRAHRWSSRVETATRFVGRRGWWALVVARFTAILRAMVPFTAGMSHMPYPRFLLGNAVGGIAWGTIFTLVGFVAGTNYSLIESWIRTGGLLVVILVALIGAVVWATHRAQKEQSRLAASWQRIARRRPLRYLIDGVQRSGRPALTLSLTAAATIASLWVYGFLVEEVLDSQKFLVFDFAAMRYLNDGRIPILIAVAKFVNAATAAPWMPAGAVVVALAAFGIQRRRVATALGLAMAGQWAIVRATAVLVDMPPPAIDPLVPRLDSGFPSGHVALVTVVVIVLAWPWNRPGWRAGTLRFGIAAMVITLTATARVILLVEYPSDVIAGAAVAAAWTLLVCLTVHDAGPGRHQERSRLGMNEVAVSLRGGGRSESRSPK